MSAETIRLADWARHVSPGRLWLAGGADGVHIPRPFKTCMARICPTTPRPILTFCPISMLAGTYSNCIWDAGGTDEIVYNGVRDVTIDLRAATLDNTPTGGGAVPYADSIFGGFTSPTPSHRERKRWFGQRSHDR